MNDDERRELTRDTLPLHETLRAFVEDRISVQEFERAFFKIWPTLQGDASGPPFEEIERYFSSVERHVADPRLREDGDITTEELKRRTVDFLQLIDVD